MYDAHEDSIYQIVLKNNSNELVSASEDGQVKIWDIRTKTCSSSIKPDEFQVIDIKFFYKFYNFFQLNFMCYLIHL